MRFQFSLCSFQFRDVPHLPDAFDVLACDVDGPWSVLLELKAFGVAAKWSR